MVICPPKSSSFPLGTTAGLGAGQALACPYHPPTTLTTTQLGSTDGDADGNSHRFIDFAEDFVDRHVERDLTEQPENKCSDQQPQSHLLD